MSVFYAKAFLKIDLVPYAYLSTPLPFSIHWLSALIINRGY